jgi:hypothetical protein
MFLLAKTVEQGGRREGCLWASGGLGSGSKRRHPGHPTSERGEPDAVLWCQLLAAFFSQRLQAAIVYRPMMFGNAEWAPSCWNVGQLKPRNLKTSII